MKSGGVVNCQGIGYIAALAKFSNITIAKLPHGIGKETRISLITEKAIVYTLCSSSNSRKA